MYRHGPRRSPFRLLAFIIAAVLLVNLLGGLAGGALATGIGVFLFLPFLFFKFFLVMILFRAALRFVFSRRGPRGPWGPRRGEPQPQSEEEAEFNDAVRRARERLDDLYPQP